MTRASMTLLWFSLTIFVSLGLYHTSYRVEELGRNLRALNGEIEAEQRNLHVLKAEWVYLSNPARIEAAARKHLDLQPTAPQQVTQLARLASVVPAKGEPATRYAAAPAPRIMTASAAPQARPAAAKPKPSSDEAGRVNTHMVMGQASSHHVLPDAPSMQVVEDQTLAYAVSGTLP